MNNIYESVDANKRQSVFVVAIFIIFFAVTSYFLGYYFDAPEIFPLALFFSGGSALISFYFGDSIALSLNHAIPADRKRFFNLYTITENLSMATGLPKPRVYVIESNAPNAFATGRDPQHATICVTTGLLEVLNRTQLEAVIAHEMSHIKNFDTRLMTIVSILVGTLSIFIDLATRHSFFNSKDDNDRRGSSPLMIIGIILIIFAPFIGQLIQLAISRRREFLADSSAVLMTRQPSGLIEALTIISTNKYPADFASTATASLYITNPFSHNKIASLFSTHPPIEERIKALQGMI